MPKMSKLPKMPKIKDIIHFIGCCSSYFRELLPIIVQHLQPLTPDT
jgi:hypothetical protein